MFLYLIRIMTVIRTQIRWIRYLTRAHQRWTKRGTLSGRRVKLKKTIPVTAVVIAVVIVMTNVTANLRSVTAQNKFGVHF